MERHGGENEDGRGERNHHVNVVIYQKASLSPHKPKCHHLNPALIRPALNGEDRRLRGLTISVVYNNINRLVMVNV